MKRFIALIGSVLMAAALLSGCSKASSVVAGNPEKGVTIVYTNDIHSYVANTKTIPETKEKVSGLRLSKVSQMVKDFRGEGKAVILVDAGDQIQGNSYGSIDNGLSVIDVMNAAGYQLATPGNHDFDYGTKQFFKIKKRADFPYISCNFNGASKKALDAVKIYDAAGVKIAFVGITTPETITTSTPVYFQDGKGNYIYTIDGMINPEDMYDAVQAAIDSVKDKVDYVIALGHVGVGLDEKRNRISSEDVIANTAGLTAYIDGHSHTTMEAGYVEDKSGKDVLLTQTGAYLNAVGVLTIDSEGKVSAKLVNSYDGEDKKVAEVEDKLIARINEKYGKKIAVNEQEFFVNNPENQKQRLIRAMEMNAGDFVADAYYWYFNESKKIDCDLVLQNAGGVRNYIKPGDVTEQDIKNVAPFGNMVCLIKASGQQILDALEMGSTVIGIWDKEWDAPAENGGFLHVAGLRYKIDPKIKTSVQTDEKKMFKAVTGSYRVKDVEVYNKKTCQYEPLKLDGFYSVGGLNYFLRNGGNGLSMFNECEMLVDFVGQDSEIITMYVKSFTKAAGYPLIKTENSALAGYKGYQIDYKNPYGAGRITIEE